MQRRVRSLLLGIMVVAIGALLFLPHLLPRALSRYRSDVHFFIPTGEKIVFVTIDDAPSSNTLQILEVLKAHDVPATFFVTADRATSPASLQAIAAAGHSLGNHLRTTAPTTTLGRDTFTRDFEACAELLAPFAQVRLFRPSSDLGTREQVEYARRRGCNTVMGTIFPLDHWISNPTWLARISRWLTIPGGILILHDGDARGKTTAEVLDRLLPQLKAAGYRFGRLDEAVMKTPEL